MSADVLLIGGLVLGCTSLGMLLGAWIAARGFERALVQTMNDPEAPWHDDPPWNED